MASLLTDLWRRNPAVATTQFDVLRRELERLFDETAFSRTDAGTGWTQGVMIKMDAAETPERLVLTAELPGVDLSEVSVTVTNGILSIRGEKRSQRDDKNSEYQLTERSYGAFERRVRIPDDVDPSAIGAEFVNGVLTLTIPKPSDPKPAVHQIKIRPPPAG
jgi:HSP20 family protein